MHLYKLNNNINKDLYLKNLQVDTSGINILKSKMNLNLILIKDINVIGANILKQDALSIGADVATPMHTITHKKDKVDVILIANDKQLKNLSKKELIQPFGLKEVAKELQNFTKYSNFTPKIMGVINTDNNSFYTKSIFNNKNAIDQIQTMIDDGANIIDIGGVSTKPFSKEVSQEQEFERVKNIIDDIYKQKLYTKATFSIDTQKSFIAKYALDKGFHIVNDISSFSDKDMANTIKEYDATVVIMHMQGTPVDMQENPFYKDVIQEVDEFFREKIKIAQDAKIKNIILDIGIGFGKRLEDNINLIKHISHFQHFGYEILVGASRKSMIDNISPSKIEDRLAGSLSIHQQSLQNGASIIRCHDVKEHIQMLRVFESIK